MFAIVLLTVFAVAQLPNLAPGEVTIQSSAFLPLSTFHAQSNSVDVGVVVRDGEGRPVAGLTRGDFAVLDNGRQQTLTSFSAIVLPGRAGAPAPAAPAPSSPAAAMAPPPRRARFVALYFDDLHTDAGDLGRARMAARKFVDTGLTPGDNVGVFTGSNTLTQPFTSEAAAVNTALAKLRPHLHMELNGEATCPRITPEQAYNIVYQLDAEANLLAVQQAYQCNCVDVGTPTFACRNQQQPWVDKLAQTTWDATRIQSQATLDSLAGVISALAHQPGDRMLVLTSAGFLTETLEPDEDTLIAAAVRDGIVIDGLDTKGLVATGYVDNLPGDVVVNQGYLDTYRLRKLSSDLVHYTDGMAALAQGTGGRLFWNNNDLTAGYEQLVADPEVSYVLTFSPEPFTADGSFHALNVKLTMPGHLTVQARKGYYAVAAAAAAAAAAPSAAPADELTEEALADDTRADIPVTVTTSAGPAAGAESTLVIREWIDANRLRFSRQADIAVSRLTIAAVLIGPGGAPVAGKRATMSLRLSETSLAALLTSGIPTVMTLASPPGDYRLRVITREEETGSLAAASYPVTLR